VRRFQIHFTPKWNAMELWKKERKEIATRERKEKRGMRKLFLE
jgi:hypothetical protein